MYKLIIVAVILAYLFINSVVSSAFGCAEKNITTPLIKEDVRKTFQTQ